METTDQYSVKALIHTLGLEAFYRDGVIIDRKAIDTRFPNVFRQGKDVDPFSGMMFGALGRELAAIQQTIPVPPLPPLLDEICARDLIDSARYMFFDEIVLTKAGVNAALEVRSTFQGKNITTEWFDRFLTPDQYNRIVRHVANKTRHSRDDSEIREFVHEYIANTSARDGLRDRILSGNDPSPACVRSWVWRQVLSLFRNEGTDAQTRTVKGAKNERDLRGEPSPVRAAVNVPGAVLYASEGGADGDPGVFATGDAIGGCALVDVMDTAPTPEERLAHQQAVERGMARLEASVRAYKPAAADRYVRILGYLAEGMSSEQVAVAEKVTPARAATLLAEVRAAGRHRAHLDRVRVGVVKFLMDEPMATVGDMSPAELNVKNCTETHIRDAVTELVAEGVIVWRRGGSLEVCNSMELHG